MLLGSPSLSHGPHVRTMPPITREHREALYEAHVSRLVLCFDVRLGEEDDGRCVGEAYIANLAWPRACGELSVAIFSPDDRRRGYGTDAAGLACAYAFDGLGLNRMSLRFPVENVAATAATERAAPSLGARKVGIEREAEWVFGHHGDVAVWEVLRAEFPPHAATAELRTPPGEFES
jgi:RimJ/RimL family protein N-acetyltransferase